MSLRKTAGSTVKPVHQCKLLADAGTIEYSLASAARYAISTPCTNRPMQCPKCPFVIWSYSMADHFAEKHPTIQMPDELAHAVALRYHEKDGTLPLLTKYPKSMKNICKGASCPCKEMPHV